MGIFIVIFVVSIGDGTSSDDTEEEDDTVDIVDEGDRDGVGVGR